MGFLRGVQHKSQLQLLVLHSDSWKGNQIPLKLMMQVSESLASAECEVVRVGDRKSNKKESGVKDEKEQQLMNYPAG